MLVDIVIPILICSPIIIWGVVLLLATKDGAMPRWLRWWTKHTNVKLALDERSVTQANRTSVDGMYIVILGVLMALWAVLLPPIVRTIGESLFPVVGIASVLLVVLGAGPITAWLIRVNGVPGRKKTE